MRVHGFHKLQLLPARIPDATYDLLLTNHLFLAPALLSDINNLACIVKIWQSRRNFWGTKVANEICGSSYSEASFHGGIAAVMVFIIGSIVGAHKPSVPRKDRATLSLQPVLSRLLLHILHSIGIKLEEYRRNIRKITCKH
jgi:hypothetical protein